MAYFSRGDNKIQVDFSSKDVYRFYKKKYKTSIPRSLFINILKEFNSEMLRMVVYDGAEFYMGQRLGSIRIKKFDNSLKLSESGTIENKLRPDWKKTLDYWKKLYPNKSIQEIKLIENKPLIYHLNEHTDGIVLRWYWDKLTSTARNQTAYKFEPVRTVKREAAQAWKKIPTLKDKYYG